MAQEPRRRETVHYDAIYRYHPMFADDGMRGRAPGWSASRAYRRSRGAVQRGSRHTRGTPTKVIEADAVTWLSLATGALTWAEAEASGAVRASGQRADLTARSSGSSMRSASTTAS